MSIKKPTALEGRADGSNAGRLWIITVDHSVQHCFEDGYFNHCKSQIGVGDTIRVNRVKKSLAGQRLMEQIEIEVIEVTEKRDYFEFDQVSPMKTWPERGQKAEDVPTVKERHVPEDCTAQWKGPKGLWWVIGDSGEVYAKSIESKDVAHSIARGDTPLREAA